MRSPVLPPIRMNAAETSASSAIAPCTPLTVVPRSSTTAEIDTFISDVSTTRTNIAIARSSASRPLNGTVLLVSASMAQPSTTGLLCGPPAGDETLTEHGVGGAEEAGMRLTEQMQRVVTEQSLGFVATVRPDGTPALSPKGTTRVWGDSRLVFLHIHSPGTVANLAVNPAVEVNVVDPILRKGW